MANSFSISVKIDARSAIKRLQSQRFQVAALPKRALDYFIKITPIDTGYAKSRTSIRNGKTIVANYPYAERLDNGYSKQTEDGMTKPTIDWLEIEFRKIFKR